MSNYTVATNFGAKDALASGNPAKLILGAQLTTEFNNIATAIASKVDSGGAFSGTTGTFSGLVQAQLGLTVTGAVFQSGGITDNATATALTIGSNGSLTVAAATAAVSLSASGAASQYAAQFVANSTSGQSFGLAVNGGTTNADRAFHVTNQAASTSYFDVYGDGGVTVGTPTGTSQGTGSLNATTLFINGTAVYAGVPQNSQAASYAPVLSDNGRHIFFTVTGKTLTIPANSTTAFPIGACITVANASGVTTTLTVTTDLLTWAATGNTGSRTLAPNGLATFLKVGATSWLVSGSGIS